MVSQQSFRLDGAGVPLSATLFVPQGDGPHPGLVICHGMPAGPRPEPGAPPPPDDGLDYPGVAEWCALEGFATLIFNFRGTGDSEGNFHPMGWAHDLDSVISWMLARPEVDARRLALLGSSMGAAVAVYAAAHRTEVAGLVSFAGPAETRARTRPAEDVERMREMGIIRDPDFPPSLEEWAAEGLGAEPGEVGADDRAAAVADTAGRCGRRCPAAQRGDAVRARRRGQRAADAAGREAPLPQ